MEKIWDIPYWWEQLMQHMILIRQNLSEQLIVLFLANLSKRNLFKQKAKTFEFVHNSLYASLGRCPGHFPEFGTSQTMSSEDSQCIHRLNSGSGDVVYTGCKL